MAGVLDGSDSGKLGDQPSNLAQTWQNLLERPHERTVGQAIGITDFSNATSYRSYLDRRVRSWTDFRWLRRFLDQHGPSFDTTEVTVLDLVEGHDFPKTIDWGFKGTQDVECIDNFTATVKSRLIHPGFRLIMVSYQGLAHLNRNVVDALALVYDIDPHILLYKFGYMDARSDYDTGLDYHQSSMKLPIDGPGGMIYPWLPTESIKEIHRDSGIVELYCSDRCAVLSQFYRGPVNRENHGTGRMDLPTVIIWNRPEIETPTAGSFGAASPFQKISISNTPCGVWGESLHQSYLKNLESYWHEMNLSPEQSLYTIGPLIQLLLRNINREFYRHHRISIQLSPPQSLKEPQGTMEHLRRLRDNLTDLKKAVGAILAANTTPAQPMVAANFVDIYKDIGFLLDDFDRAQDTYWRQAKQMLMHNQIQEVQRSTKMATSIGKLTKLAFIFIPLSFSTSFFGMNVQEFGNGRIRLWMFVAAALTLSAFTLIPIRIPIRKRIRKFCWGKSPRRWEPESVRKRSLVAYSWKLAVISPFASFCFSVFCLFHSIHRGWIVDALCRDTLDTGFYTKIGFEGSSTDTASLKDATRDELPISRFWRKLVTPIFELTAQPGWTDIRFYHAIQPSMSKSTKRLAGLCRIHRFRGWLPMMGRAKGPGAADKPEEPMEVW